MSFYNSHIFDSRPELLEGNIQIIACAGSGKTEFIAERIAYMIYKNIAQPNQIVAFTFTRKAANELKTRISSKCKELIFTRDNFFEVKASTIHSFAFDLIQEFEPKYKNFEIISNFKRTAFLFSLKKIINFRTLFEELDSIYRWSPKNGNKRSWTYQTFLKDIDIYRENLKLESNMFSQYFIDAYYIYREKMLEHQFIDFSEIMNIALKLLNNKKILEVIRTRYNFFTVDEYQDINDIQERIIQLLSKKENVCVVGDDDQSIYKWRGSDVENIITFDQRYGDVRRFNLETNYRSTNSIIEVTEKFIKKNIYRIEKNFLLNEKQSEKGDLFKLVFEYQNFEIDWIYQKINELYRKDFFDGKIHRPLNYSDFAIIFRSIKKDAEPYIKRLNSLNLPLIYRSIFNILENKDISIIIDILKYFSNFQSNIEYNDEYLLNIYNKLPIDKNIPFEKMKIDFEKLKSQSLELKNFSLIIFYYKILEIIGITDLNLNKSDSDSFYSNLKKFCRLIIDYESTKSNIIFNHINDFLWLITLHHDSANDSVFDMSASIELNAINIITMHESKGLEFPVVFIPNCSKDASYYDIEPTFLKVNEFGEFAYKNSIKDERCLHYVAATRSMKYLFITSSIHNTKHSKNFNSNSLLSDFEDKYFNLFPFVV